jgi:hypothetical protein
MEECKHGLNRRRLPEGQGGMAVYHGVVKGNTVVLPEDARLPDGTPVEVRVVEPQEDASDEELEMLFLERLLEVGMISEIKPRGSRSPADDFTPIEVKGRPLSEIVIEERR